MIAIQHKKEIIVSDEFEEKSLKISESSQEELVYNLIKNLYKYPISAVVKELASNLRDTMIEVGNPNGEVIIELVEENKLLGNSACIKFQDFGSGFSPEKFNNIYRNLGESTKKQSNDYNGSFGAGSKTPFAYTETYTIETVHNNIKYVYIGIDNGTKFVYNLLSKEEVNMPNQTIVVVPIKSKNDLTEFENAVSDKIVFMKNIKFIGFKQPEFIITYEDDDILVFNSNDIGKRLQILAGEVQYPINFQALGLESHYYNNPYNNISMCLKFKIGELQPTLSREDFNYTEDTKKKIHAKLNKARKILKTQIELELSKEQDYIKWYSSIVNRGTKTFQNQWNFAKVSENISFITDTKDHLEIKALEDWLAGHKVRTVTPYRKRYGRSSKIKQEKEYETFEIRDSHLNLPIFRYEGLLSARKCLFLFEDNPKGFIVVKDEGLSSIKTKDGKDDLKLQAKLNPYYNEASKWSKLLPSYDELEVPDDKFTTTSEEDYKTAYQKIIKQRKLEGKFTAKKVRLKDSWGSNIFDFGMHEDKFENIKDSLIIYGYQDDNNQLLDIAHILSSCEDFKIDFKGSLRDITGIQILKISQNYTKQFESLPNAYSIKDVLAGNTIFNKYFEYIDIAKNYLEELHTFVILKEFEYICKEMKESYDFCSKITDKNNRHSLSSQEITLIQQIVNSKNLENQKFKEEFNKIKEFFNGVELLKSVKFDEKITDYIKDFLKLKNKI